MSFTWRMRLFLVLVALLPPAAILTVVYVRSSSEVEAAERREIRREIDRAAAVLKYTEADIEAALELLSIRPEIRSAELRLQRPGAAAVELDLPLTDLDFLEIINREARVAASYHRPGLIGRTLDVPGDALSSPERSMVVRTVEYDVRGRHAALTGLLELDSGLRLYGGRYIDSSLTALLGLLSTADVEILFAEDDTETAATLARMDTRDVYASGDAYRSVLTSGPGYFLVADFLPTRRDVWGGTFYTVTIVVAIASVLIAILIGVYISGKARDEFDNLITATERVASGDYSTPVMAYEEGEFSRLADSFSQMMRRIRESQQQLAATQQIAAWQTMGRKIAHEIKNPLTPIAISADDLRLAYEQDPEKFRDILLQNTQMIKTEVNRLSKLLDEFVRFARMRAPEPELVQIEKLLAEIRSMYAGEIERGRLRIEAVEAPYKAMLDREQIKQVLINLIKNALEASDTGEVTVMIRSDGDSLVISVEDRGPGFTGEQLANPFQPYVSSKEGGSGLGLVISQRVVVDHDGRIELYNRDDGGAGVRITLPLRHG